jgi:uncharacterized protein YodC (DUF2158 family)
MTDDERVVIEAGDLVRLRCGGPTMVAERVALGLVRPFATCTWFDKRGALQKTTFAISALTLAHPAPPG